MSSGRSTTWLDSFLDGELADARIALCTVAPTATSAGTELDPGDGYTTGGELIDIDAFSAGVSQGPDAAAITWTNSGATPWVIVGVVVHVAGAASPTATQVRYWNDTFTYNVSAGATLTIPIDGLTFTES